MMTVTDITIAVHGIKELKLKLNMDRAENAFHNKLD